MACKIATFNTPGFLPLQVHKGPIVPQTSHLVVSFEKLIVHSTGEIMPQMCGDAFRAFEYQMHIAQTTKEDQVEVQ
jgi:hypothetical protein